MEKLIYLMAFVMIFSSCSNRKNTNRSAQDQDNQTEGAPLKKKGDLFMLVGTYTEDAGSKGIYVYQFDSKKAQTDSVSMVEVKNPSFLTISPNQKFVYSVSENGDDDSFAHSFSFNKNTGILTAINSQNTYGGSPCYITTDGLGQNVLTANYGGGSISVLPVSNDGQLSEVGTLITFSGKGADSLKRQSASHVHTVRFSPDGRYLFATDLGADKIYRLNVNNTPFEGQPILSESDIMEFATPEGMGPRHLDFHPNMEYMYVLGEISGEVVVYDYNDGDITMKQTIASDSVGGQGSADIHVSPDGKFLYSSNRLKEDGIAIFSIDQKNGTLSRAGYQPTGRHPRNFSFTPNGKYLLVACRDDNKIQVFKVNQDTGLLTSTEKDILLSKPVCIQFMSME
ncbi:MAG: lactonase family protein [Dysgonamonadaceae bacterium]